jgi:hypothetical protein
MANRSPTRSTAILQGLIQVNAAAGVSKDKSGMSKKPASTGARAPLPASRDDLRRILGELDDPKIIEILELTPSIADLEEATMCLAGDYDILAKGGHPVSATAGRIVEILGATEEEEPPRQPG